MQILEPIPNATYSIVFQKYSSLTGVFTYSELIELDVDSALKNVSEFADEVNNLGSYCW